jgi:hypothetical protein
MSEPTRPLPPTAPAGPLTWIGGKLLKVSLSLRFFGLDLNPELVTRLLRCSPTKAYRRGDELPGRTHRLAERGSWLLKNDQSGLELPEKIADLLNRLPDDPEVWTQLHEMSTDADLFCGLFLDDWNRGLELNPELLGRIAARHLKLSLDIYSHSEDDDTPDAR